MYSDKAFGKIDNGNLGGTQWLCFYMKDKKSYYFDSLGGGPYIFLLEQLPKPITYYNYKIQEINSRFCGTYCLYFFYVTERMGYYDASLKMNFG